MTTPTQYDRPRTLDEAVALAAQPGVLALAGGAFAFGRLELPYERVVDLQDISELKAIEMDDAGMRIGAAATLSAVLQREDIPAALKASLTRTVSPHILNGASVGESVLFRDNPLLREWITALVALGAAVEVVDPQRGAAHRERRLLLMADARLEQEVITALLLAPFGAHSALGIAHVARTPADAPIVNAAVCVHFDDAGRVRSAMAALGGVADEPVTGHVLGSLSGWPLNSETAQAAAEEITAHVNPPNDYLGSSEYRTAMAAVCLARALEACIPPLGGA